MHSNDLPETTAPDQSGHWPGSETQTKKGRRTALWAAPVVGLAVLGGGGAYAYSALNGGGPQPDSVIPSTAMAYLRVDANPSLGQKVSAVRFLNKLPNADDVLSGGGKDWRKKLWQEAQKSDPSLRSIDYDNDIAPWLGDRMALAMLQTAPGQDPTAEVALEVKDDAKAKAGIAKILSTSTDANKPDITLRDGYAVLTEHAYTAKILAELDKGALTQNETYSGDMKALGDTGVFSAWMDVDSLVKTVSSKDPNNSLGKLANRADKDGRVAMALRFDPDYVELAGLSRGATSVAKLKPGEATGDLTKLPANTVAALSIPNADQIVGEVWKAFTGSSLDQNAQSDATDLEQSLGITMPQDLQTLVGKNLTIAVPDQDFQNEDVPKFGIKTITDATKADQLASRMLTSMGDAAPAFPHMVKDGAFYLGSDQGYLDDLAAGGHLGDNAGFKLAVPDAANDQFVFYADLSKLSKFYPSDLSADNRKFLDSLSAIGMSSSVKSGGDATFTVRVVGK